MLREEIILRLVEIVAVAVNAMTCTSAGGISDRISPIFENSLRNDLPLYIDSRERERESVRVRVSVSV